LPMYTNTVRGREREGDEGGREEGRKGGKRSERERVRGEWRNCGTSGLMSRPTGKWSDASALYQRGVYLLAHRHWRCNILSQNLEGAAYGVCMHQRERGQRHVWQSVAERNERTRQWSGTENRGTEKKRFTSRQGEERAAESGACCAHRSSAKPRLFESPSIDKSRVSRAMAAAARRISFPLLEEDAPALGPNETIARAAPLGTLELLAYARVSAPTVLRLPGTGGS